MSQDKVHEIKENIRVNLPFVTFFTLIGFIISVVVYGVNWKNDVEHRLENVEIVAQSNQDEIETVKSIQIDLKVALVEVMTDVKWLRADRERQLEDDK